MAQHIQGEDGKMAGSIGNGKNSIPTPRNLETALPVTLQPLNTPTQTVDATYARFTDSQTSPANPAPELPYGPLGELRAKWALTMGECHNLALAVHEHTGWPLIGFSPWLEDDHGTTGILTHVAVLTPDGYVLDGHGVTPVGHAEENLESDHTVINSIKDLETWMAADTINGSSEWLPTRPADFTGYVPQILAQYETR
jgi:hypothetical protein